MCSLTCYLQMLALTKNGGSRVYDDDTDDVNVMDEYITGQDAPDKLIVRRFRKDGHDQIG